MGGQTFELNPAKWIYSPCWGGVLFWHRDQDVVQHETKPYMSRVLLSGWSPGSQAINRLCTQCSCSIPFTHPYLWVCFLRLCVCVCASHPQGSKVQTRVGLLMLLCTWISNCPIAVTHFLHNQENVPFVSSFNKPTSSTSLFYCTSFYSDGWNINY